MSWQGTILCRSKLAPGNHYGLFVNRERVEWGSAGAFALKITRAPPAAG